MTPAAPEGCESHRRDGLEDGGLGVVAEDLLQRLDDLALAGVRAGAREQRLHQVALGVRGVLAQLGERALDRGAVALGARALQAVELLALERGVDAQRRDRLFVGGRRSC